MAPAQDRRPRGPGFVYSVISLVMLVFVTIIGLTVSQPPPPSIAEFAPQAVEQITDAPSEQTSSIGRGTGGSGGDGDGPGGLDHPVRTPPPIEVPRVRKCVGDPPRQIEDPQSPPCVPYWEGDNGGSTHKGVGKDEIVVAYPRTQAQAESEATYFPRTTKGIETFFNRRFEFYGRKLRLVPYTVTPGSTCWILPSPEAVTNDAIKVDEQIGAFASFSYCAAPGFGYIYYEALARRKIISTTSFPLDTTSDWYTRNDPYIWNYMPPMDRMGQDVADYICSALKDRPARYSPDGRRDAALGGKRIFGLGYTTTAGMAPPLDALRDHLKACGVKLAVDVDLPLERQNDTAYYDNVVLRAKAEGVTTFICFCHVGAGTGKMFYAASRNGWFPEWFLPAYFGQDWEFMANFAFFWANKEQAHQVMGLFWRNRYLPLADEFWYQAINEVDPSYNGNDTNTDYDIVHWEYKNMLLLASGIQMAGPNLTPQTFRDGLMRARFSNPGAGGPPYFQSRVGFGPQDHSMQGDATAVWWSTEQQPYQPPAPDVVARPSGAYCYLEQGKRYTPGAFPKNDNGLFGECR